MTLALVPTPATAQSGSRVPIGEKLAYGTGSIIDMWGNWLYVGMVWPVFRLIPCGRVGHSRIP